MQQALIFSWIDEGQSHRRYKALSMHFAKYGLQATSNGRYIAARLQKARAGTVDVYVTELPDDVGIYRVNEDGDIPPLPEPW